MINYLAKIFNSNWFFISLIIFVLFLPFSEALISISGGIILFTALVEDNWKNKIERAKRNKILWFIIGIFLIFLLSSVITFKSGQALYDIRKNLFFLVIPLAFLIGKTINDFQKRFLFYAFIFSISVSIILSLIRWITITNSDIFETHNISLISHIRFSFQLILAFWFLVLFLQNNNKTLHNKHKYLLLILAVFVISFLFFQQSLTGLIAFGGSIGFYILYLIIQLENKIKKVVFLISAVVLLLIPVVYVLWAVYNFYDIEKVDKNLIDKETKFGNYYQHDFNNPMVENGRYVFLYVCESEMREEWNKISECKYDSIGKNGYVNSSTLMRYLTSKGLRKDAEGIHALNQQDIQNVENGIANIIYQKNKYSIYPRIYQTIWEYYIYSKTGNANYQSFSQRIEFSKAALTIIKRNIWFGVGTGNWKAEFRKAYQENNSKLSEELYASSHNQYLNYMVKFGFVGLIVIIFLIIYPVFYTRRNRDTLFMIFLIFLFFANFADSNFESHMGNSFFTFFYCVFLVSGTDRYLHL